MQVQDNTGINHKGWVNNKGENGTDLKMLYMLLKMTVDRTEKAWQLTE